MAELRCDSEKSMLDFMSQKARRKPREVLRYTVFD